MKNLKFVALAILFLAGSNAVQAAEAVKLDKATADVFIHLGTVENSILVSEKPIVAFTASRQFPQTLAKSFATWLKRTMQTRATTLNAAQSFNAKLNDGTLFQFEIVTSPNRHLLPAVKYFFAWDSKSNSYQSKNENLRVKLGRGAEIHLYVNTALLTQADLEQFGLDGAAAKLEEQLQKHENDDYDVEAPAGGDFYPVVLTQGQKGEAMRQIRTGLRDATDEQIVGILNLLGLQVPAAE